MPAPYPAHIDAGTLNKVFDTLGSVDDVQLREYYAGNPYEEAPNDHGIELVLTWFDCHGHNVAVQALDDLPGVYDMHVSDQGALVVTLRE